VETFHGMGGSAISNARTMHRALVSGVVVLVALWLAGVADAGVAQRAAGVTVTVTITDRSVRVSPTNPESGATRFVVVNKGKKGHVFSIAGPGLKGKRTDKIGPGKSATLTVTLRPGAYVLSDPVGLGVYTSAFISVSRAADVTGRGTSNQVQPEVTPPEMCGVYFSP
jgi:hypothetical protein